MFSQRNSPSYGLHNSRVDHLVNFVCNLSIVNVFIEVTLCFVSLQLYLLTWYIKLATSSHSKTAAWQHWQHVVTWRRTTTYHSINHQVRRIRHDVFCASKYLSVAYEQIILDTVSNGIQ